VNILSPHDLMRKILYELNKIKFYQKKRNIIRTKTNQEEKNMFRLKLIEGKNKFSRTSSFLLHPSNDQR
jgi:hypothetical protein